MEQGIERARFARTQNDKDAVADFDHEAAIRARDDLAVALAVRHFQ